VVARAHKEQFAKRARPSVFANLENNLTHKLKPDVPEYLPSVNITKFLIGYN
jgi:hypothetical protein